MMKSHWFLTQKWNLLQGCWMSEPVNLRHQKLTRMSRRLREPADTNRPEDYTEKDRKGFCVKILPGKGRAVFTTKNFHSGEFLLHYHGELIDKAEAEERERFEETGFRYFFKYRGKNLWRRKEG
eukprot:XP_011668526.1 PREDICTED: N-lysine methyltransferase SETD8-like [Strongylocentrotus purpuratus]